MVDPHGGLTKGHANALPSFAKASTTFTKVSTIARPNNVMPQLGQRVSK
jgi:hypothetical protein